MLYKGAYPPDKLLIYLRKKDAQLEKKFFQKYTLNSVEEVIAIASLFSHTIGTDSDMLFGNLFTEENMVGKDNVDLSHCFFVTEDVTNTLGTYINKYPQFKDVLEAHAEMDAHSMLDTLKALKSKMLGEDTLAKAIEEDVSVFGDDVSYYDNCPIVIMFKVLEVFE